MSNWLLPLAVSYLEYAQLLLLLTLMQMLVVISQHTAFELKVET